MWTPFLLLFLIVPPILGINGDGTIGRTDLFETTPNPSPGLFIDLDNPASCTGVITEWSLCYYNPRIFNFEDNLQVVLQIWRFTQQTSTQMSRQVATVSIPEAPESFQCIKIPLDQEAYVNVTEGDVIGVSLANNAVLPIVANFNFESQNGRPPRLLFFQPSLVQLMNVIISEGTIISNQVLHVTAEIVTDIRDPPTVPGQTDATIPGGTDTPTTPGREDGSLAVVATVVVIVTLFILGIVAAAAGLALFMRRRRSRSKALPGFVIDNAVYDHPNITPSRSSFKSSGAVIEESTYEIPVEKIRRKPHPSLPRQPPHLEDSSNMYSTVEGTDVVTSGYGLSPYTDSKEGGDNAYATLTSVNIDYYNTFFRQATSEIYSNPDSVTNETPFLEPPYDEKSIYNELSMRTRTIRKSEIKIYKKIGEGAFSSVSKGSWTWMGMEYDVAIKALIQTSSELDKIKLLQEAATMGQFQHPNIVKLFGVVKKGSLPMLVTEFLEKGDLLDALQTIHPDSTVKLAESKIPSLLLSYSQQVALGMHYLSSKGFVHRDLAARNIFVTKDNICKVGDFGMSRELADTDYYVSRGGVVPVRWTAPEAIFYRKYSTTSDVWSYGCLLYEIWTLGMRPYEGIATSKYLETLQVGYRLPPPPGCPRDIYSIMIKCWHPISSDRPTFSEILASLLKDEVLSIPAEDQIAHPQAHLLGASLEAGLEMYKDLQNTYLGQQSSSPSHKTKKYTTMEKQRVATVESQRSGEAVGSSDESQGQYEMEEEAETSSGYQNINVA